ncbi:hypothetical protein M408DRAFT_26452 [Serendipita vermifera MAFF 305830]|uniref:Uncharacterized protein n=2 Tax=Serendipita vermifera MAFF 305830 TaxID=933852 RepID=A0A0C2WFS6_SERVB|nr:hypothetical protein M408DRAFT_26452 [Serendipita vermifera MAFF 305830]
MKRLFTRREKDRPARNGGPVSALTDGPQNEVNVATTSNKINGHLAPIAEPGVARRKSSFFLSVMGSSRNSTSTTTVTVQGSQSGSETGSVPPTSRSISGSSDASSSFVSTPLDERLTPATSTAPSQTISEAKTWPSWMGSIGSKGKSKVVTPLSSFRLTPTTALPVPKMVVAENSSDDEDNDNDGSESEESQSSSWDDLSNDPNLVSANRKSRGRTRTPAAGRRQLTPHSKQAQARAVFGNRVGGAVPLTKEASKALANLQALTIDALVPPTCAPPLVQTSSSVPFPRSSNRVQTLVSTHRQHSPLHSEILRKRLLRRIERRVLTETEQESIQRLAKRTPRPRNADQRRLPAAEETYEDSKAVGGGWSKGMKRWAMRPCFEERVVVWNAQASGVTVCPVQRDSKFGVATLEFSEGAEALAGLHRQNELPPPPSDIYVPASNRKLPPPLVIPRASNGSSLASSLNPLASRGRLPSSRLRIDSALMSGQDEDDLPLGVVMVQRRQKEEAEERKRRAIVEKQEKERKEEERKRQYAEQVAAARSRREGERTGKPGATRDAWAAGDPDALPPPIKPYASHPVRSSSNPDITSANNLQVNRPFGERRMTSESSVSVRSGTTVTSKQQETPRQQTIPPVPSPWTGMPARQNSYPRIPSSAPAGQLNYGVMGMPVVPDPLSLAMFEQGLLRPWAMDAMSASGTGTLTPPRPPFGFGSSGDSSGSLTPPRFPNSRPPSWGSSSEDVRLTMQRMGSVGSLGSGARPMSGAYSSGGSAQEAAGQEWRNSRSSMLVSPVEDPRNRSQSRSPIDSSSPTNAGVPGQNKMVGSMRSIRSENGHASQQQQSQHRSRPSASSTSRLRPQETSQSRSRTQPPPLPTAPGASVKGAYGLPTIDSQGSMGSVSRPSPLSTSRSTERLNRASSTKTAGKGSATTTTGGQEKQRTHGHSKSSGAPASQRKHRLFG